MNLLAGIVVSVVGLLLVVLSFSNIIRGFSSLSFSVLIFGLLIIGLSYIKKPSSNGPAKMSTVETLTAIFHSPGEVFQNLKFHPRWLVAVLIMSLLSTVYINLFMYRLTPERVTNYAIDKTMQISFVKDNEQAKAQMESNRPQAIADSKNPAMRVGQSASTFIWQVFYFAFFALFFYLFVLIMGGNLNYWQAFSATVYSYFPIAVIRFVLNSTILFLKEPDDIHPILGQGSLIQDNLGFLVSTADSPVMYVLLSSLSLLGFFWIWLMANGLKNSGESVSSSIAWSASVVKYLLIVLFGVGLAFLFPGFIS